MRGNWKGKKKREAGTEGGVNSGGIGRIKRRIDATVGSVGIRRETLRVRAGSVRPYIIASNCRLVCVGKYIGLAFRNRSRLRTFDWERRLGFSLDSRSSRKVWPSEARRSVIDIPTRVDGFSRDETHGSGSSCWPMERVRRNARIQSVAICTRGRDTPSVPSLSSYYV